MLSVKHSHSALTIRSLSSRSGRGDPVKRAYSNRGVWRNKANSMRNSALFRYELLAYASNFTFSVMSLLRSHFQNDSAMASRHVHPPILQYSAMTSIPPTAQYSRHFAHLYDGKIAKSHQPKSFLICKIS